MLIRNHFKSHNEEIAVFRITDFPDELITAVFNNCDFRTLHSLTATSRFICNITFPIFLKAARLTLPRHDRYLSRHAPRGILDINTPEKALALCVWK